MDIAAYQSLPEAEVSGRRLALARRVLDAHAPRDQLAFLFKHGRPAEAVALLYPPCGEENEETLEGTDAEDWQPAVDRLATFAVFVPQICQCYNV